MRNLLLTLRYDGTQFHGWQIQPNAVTVQQELCNALKRISGNDENIIGCSRTDAGVHAKEYVCSFKGETTIPTDKIPIVLNTFLPDDIRAYKCEEVPDDFNARFCTLKKAYEYKILNAPVSDPNLRRNVWHYPINLDFEEMKKAIKAREIMLKGQSRAKTAHPGEFNPNDWIGGGELDYRFNNAKTIIRDIFESEGKVNVKS